MSIFIGPLFRLGQQTLLQILSAAAANHLCVNPNVQSHQRFQLVQHLFRVPVIYSYFLLLSLYLNKLIQHDLLIMIVSFKEG